MGLLGVGLMFVAALKCPECDAIDSIHASGVIHSTVRLGVDFAMKNLRNAEEPSQGDFMVDLVKCHECKSTWKSMEELTRALQEKGVDVKTEEEALDALRSL